MDSQLIVDVNSLSGSAQIALLEDGNLVEMRTQHSKSLFSVGNIYLGQVRKVKENINAAFVDIGSKKQGFLPLKDLGQHYPFMVQQVKQLLKENRGKVATGAELLEQFAWVGPSSAEEVAKLPGKHDSIANHVKVGQYILVKIEREPYSNKGPTLTGMLSIAGHFMVLLPFANKVHISSRIENREEAQRLQRLVQSIIPKGMGVIIRTAAQGKKSSVLHAELQSLIDSWQNCLIQLCHASMTPQLILGELNSSAALLRDNLNESYSSIWVNNRQVYDELRAYLATIAPENVEKVKFYNVQRVPIFDHFDVTKQIKRLLGKTVMFHKGSYLIIQHPEAFHVIDVNSGSGAKRAGTPEETAFEVNLAACDEIARQLRLRDMGGIIVIDFIDMNKSEHRRKILERMQELMKNDKVTHKVIPITEVGLMQITRQRQRPEQRVNTMETCPCCGGTGKVESTLMLEDEITNKVIDLCLQHKGAKYDIRVHPFVEAYFNRGLFSLRHKLNMQYGGRFRFVADSSLPLMSYHIYDREGNEIDGFASDPFDEEEPTTPFADDNEG